MLNKIKTAAKYLTIGALFIAACLVCAAGGGMTAHAEGSPEDKIFTIDAQMLAGSSDTLDISVTVSNAGDDWEGTVRLTPNEDYDRNLAAYDTAISLPQGSTKQFVVKIPKSEESVEGTVRITLLDKKSNKVEDKVFRKLLKEYVKALPMGILSDSYTSLTYLDMGGNTFYYSNSSYPIRLMELSSGSIAEYLDSLIFLVIDGYDTDVLTDEEIRAIDDWVDNGGVLIIGTGKYAEETLKGFDSLNIECVKVGEPGEYSVMEESGLDAAHLSIAQLIDSSGWSDTSYYCKAMTRSVGNGAIGVLPYSLLELGGLDASAFQSITQEEFVMTLLDEVSSQSNARYGSTGYNSYTDYTYIVDRIFAILGNCNSALNFGILKFIVIAYVVFVGPLLYLLLRFTKKRELYWLAVPATAFMVIVLIFFAGRGFEVVSTRVYSVSLENLSDRAGSKSYMYCYDANRKEWDLRLADGYEYVGALAGTGYNYSSGEGYYYHIQKEGDEFYFGINPDSSFDDSYFVAGKSGQKTKGSIRGDGVISGTVGVYGTVTNDTEWDFSYFAVVSDGVVYVYENLPSGESCVLDTAEYVYSSSQSWRNDVCSAYLYDFMYDEYNSNSSRSKNNKSDMSEISALGVGLCSVYSEKTANKTLIIGVTKDWDKVVDDNCSEISYGCLYAIQ